MSGHLLEGCALGAFTTFHHHFEGCAQKIPKKLGLSSLWWSGCITYLYDVQLTFYGRTLCALQLFVDLFKGLYCGTLRSRVVKGLKSLGWVSNGSILIASVAIYDTAKRKDSLRHCNFMSKLVCCTGKFQPYSVTTPPFGSLPRSPPAYVSKSTSPATSSRPKLQSQRRHFPGKNLIIAPAEPHYQDLKRATETTKSRAGLYLRCVRIWAISPPQRHHG